MLLTRTKVKRTKVEHRRRISKRLSSVMTSPETSGADSEVFVVVENQGESDFTDRQITLLVTSTEIRLIAGAVRRSNDLDDRMIRRWNDFDVRMIKKGKNKSFDRRSHSKC